MLGSIAACLKCEISLQKIGDLARIRTRKKRSYSFIQQERQYFKGLC